MTDHKLIAAAFAKRLGRRGVNVSKTADYICALERAIECAETVLTKNPSQLFELDPMPAGIMEGTIALVRDATGNHAVLWYHDGGRDLLVSMTPGFGEPVAIQSLGLIRGDTEPEPVDFPVGRGTTSGELLMLHDQAEREPR